MSKDVARWTGGSGLARHEGGAGAGVDAGRARSMDQLRFETKAPSLDDVPAGFLDGSTQGVVIGPGETAGAISQAKKAFITAGRAYQVRTSWVLHGQQLVVSKVMRPLQKVAQGKLAPVPGRGWALAEQTVYELLGARPERASIVDDTLTEVAAAKAASAAQAAGGAAPDADEEGEGVLAQSALPSKVRMWLNREVGSPSFWHGQVLRWEDGTETIDVVRASGEKVAAVRARRPVGAPSWEVVRVSGDVAARPRRTVAMDSPVAGQRPARSQLGTGLRKALGR